MGLSSPAPIQSQLWTNYEFHPDTTLPALSMFAKDFASRTAKKFPKGNIHLSEMEEEIQNTDNAIDALVFRLYDLTEVEVVTVLDSMNIEKSIKDDILKRFQNPK